MAKYINKENGEVYDIIKAPDLFKDAELIKKYTGGKYTNVIAYRDNSFIPLKPRICKYLMIHCSDSIHDQEMYPHQYMISSPERGWTIVDTIPEKYKSYKPYAGDTKVAIKLFIDEYIALVDEAEKKANELKNILNRLKNPTIETKQDINNATIFVKPKEE